MQCSISPIIRFCSSTVSRRYSTLPAFPTEDRDFLWYPRFFDQVEQHALLSAALRKLDAVEPRASRKRRRDFLAAAQAHRQDQPKDMIIGDLKNAFLPDDLYHFEEVRSWRTATDYGQSALPPAV
jgi:alkylated DNA repair protein alkB homolog 7